jgi:hypothetical protein
MANHTDAKSLGVCVVVGGSGWIGSHLMSHQSIHFFIRSLGIMHTPSLLISELYTEEKALILHVTSGNESILNF